MSNQKETNVLLTGLVRDESKLINKLNQFQNWQQRGFVTGVYMATWIGEIDKYPGLRKKIATYELTLIELEEPKLVLKGGHQLHQMLTLHYGLQAIKNKDSQVLKTRVDLADNIEEMTWELNNGVPDADDFLKIGITGKIVVEYSQLLFPFLMGDAQFFGNWKDLRALVNLNTDMELLYSRLAVEQTFFFHPFKEIGMFQNHFFWNIPHIADQQVKQSAQLDAIANSDYFIELLSAWLVVMNAYFKIGWGQETYAKPSMQLRETLLRSDSLLRGPDGSMLLTKSNQVTALLSSLSSSRLSDLKQKLLHIGDGPFFVDDQVYSELEDFRKSFTTLTSARASKFTKANTLLIKGVVQHFFVAEADSALESYRNQVTYLRRENDVLQRRLGTSVQHRWTHRTLVRVVGINRLEKWRARFPGIFSVYQKFFWWK